MNNRMKMTVKIFLIVMNDSHILLQWELILQCYEGENFQKMQYEPSYKLTK